MPFHPKLFLFFFFFSWYNCLYEVQKPVKEIQGREWSIADEWYQWVRAGGTHDVQRCPESFQWKWPLDPVWPSIYVRFHSLMDWDFCPSPSTSPCLSYYTGNIRVILPRGKEVSRCELPLQTASRGFAWLLIADITFLFYFPFAESRRLDLKWLFIACFKRELGSVRRGWHFLSLQGIIIFMAEAKGILASQT
jgi:hypothetical protein